ncbi:MAG TPA: hypothetical protein VNL35_07500 [Chloroflexota bacterium]|nr:hypothetical protein [Chloroflexota bacterium]
MKAAVSRTEDQHDDAALTALMNSAARALEEAGLTAQDLIDELPEIQEEMLRQDLGDAFVNELRRMHAALYRE